MTSAIWEPRIWQVGDRVRVRVNPECPYADDAYTGPNHASVWEWCDRRKVSPKGVGAVVFVYDLEDRSAKDGHRFRVKAARRSRYGEWEGWFTSAELEAADDDVA